MKCWSRRDAGLAKGADHDEVLEFVTASLLKKILHQPSVRLREAGEDSDQAFVESDSRTIRPGEKRLSHERLN